MTRLAFVLLFALACCTPAPTSGVVVDKRFTPSSNTLLPVSNGSGGMHLVPIHHADAWELLIDGDGEQPTAWVRVSMSEHDATAIGARWGRTVGK